MPRWLYFSNWLRGDIVQYDISDPTKPRFASRLFLGGIARKGGEYEVCQTASLTFEGGIGFRILGLFRIQGQHTLTMAEL